MLHSLARLVGLRAAAKRQGRPTKQARPALTVEALDGRCVPAALLAGSALLPDHAAVAHAADAVPPGDPCPPPPVRGTGGPICAHGDDATQVQTSAAGKVTMQDFHFVTKVNKSSP